MSHPDWTLNVPERTARHRSGMVLRATRKGSRYAVAPDLATVPAAGPGMAAADVATLHAEIARRVTEGGQLLVTAIERART